MANYVSNKIVCKRFFLNKYFIDPYSLGEESYEYCKEKKYISFNKLFGVKDVNEYYDKYGEYVYYGFFYTIKDINEELIELKFKTKHHYPICAIKKAIQVDHDIVWYTVEENYIYISKFAWEKDKVIEKTLNIESDDFYAWYEKNILDRKTYDNLESADDPVWYYDSENKKEWIIWESSDLIKRYKDNYPSNDYYKWYRNQ